MSASALPPAAIASLSTGTAYCLSIADPHKKARQTRLLYAAWRANGLPPKGEQDLPERPGRLDRPELKAPRDMPKRKVGSSISGRIALLHALSHIELNAINLSLDIVGRFGQIDFPERFYWDWLKVADDEAKHFLLLADRLQAFGGSYGDLPAHDGLWESAIATAGDPLGRLAVVPMVLEARGLDVTPLMIDKLSQVGDEATVAALRIIYEDEITHVAAGRRWFEWLANRQGHKIDEPQVLEALWQELVRQYFLGQIKRPFNKPARFEAGMQPSYYEPLADWYADIEL